MLKTKNYSSLALNQPCLDQNLGGYKSTTSRILKTNLVYIIGLTKEIANKEVKCIMYNVILRSYVRSNYSVNMEKS